MRQGDMEKDAYYNWLETTGAGNFEKVKATVKKTVTPWSDIID